MALTYKLAQSGKLPLDIVRKIWTAYKDSTFPEGDSSFQELSRLRDTIMRTHLSGRAGCQWQAQMCHQAACAFFNAYQSYLGKTTILRYELNSHYHPLLGKITDTKKLTV